MYTRTKITAAALSLGLVFLVWYLTGCGAALGIFEALSVSAPTTTLHVGESTQLTVQRKSGLFSHQELEHPSATSYYTVSESELIVEPDGRVTCVGTGGRTEDRISVAAQNGRDVGHARFDLLPVGPGPSLDFVTDVPRPATIPDNFLRYAPCCSGDPIIIAEGKTIQYKLLRHGTPAEDLTSKATYTVFFGSGVPNDTRPSVITGGRDYVSFQTFHVDSQHGTIITPPSIGQYNQARIVVFARYGQLVGWKQIVITHVEEDGREGHLRAHPQE